MEKPTHRDLTYVRQLYRDELLRLTEKIRQAREGRDEAMALWLTEVHTQIGKSAARVTEHLEAVSKPQVMSGEGQHPKN